jgi:hypothetical protein
MEYAVASARSQPDPAAPGAHPALASDLDRHRGQPHFAVMGMGDAII